MSSKIFIVDSSPAVRRMVEQVSTPEGYEVVGFQDGPAALEAAKQMSPELIIADYHLDNITFSGFCKEIGKQDNLAETLIISLINPADHPDENHLRSLGVKALLKKPFQFDNLLDVIKGLQQNGAHNGKNGKPPKRRVWPPDAHSTDSDDASAEGVESASPSEMEDAPLLDEETTGFVPEPAPSLTESAQDHAPIHVDSEKQNLTQSAESPQPVNPSTIEASMNPTPTQPSFENPPNLHAEEAMKGLLGHLLESMTERAEQKVAELLPGLITKEIATHLNQVVHAEVADQLAAALSSDHIDQTVRESVLGELPKLANQRLGELESDLRRNVRAMAEPMIQTTADQLVRELAESAVRKQLPDVVREHLGSIDLIVKDAVQEASSRHARQIAENVVREIAQESIEQAVRRIVPDMAEVKVKEEIARLTSTE